MKRCSACLGFQVGIAMKTLSRPNFFHAGPFPAACGEKKKLEGSPLAAWGEAVHSIPRRGCRLAERVFQIVIVIPARVVRI